MERAKSRRASFGAQTALGIRGKVCVVVHPTAAHGGGSNEGLHSLTCATVASSSDLTLAAQKIHDGTMVNLGKWGGVG